MTSLAFGIELSGEPIPATSAPAGPSRPGAALRFARVERDEIARSWAGRGEHVARQRSGGRTHGRIVGDDRGDLLFRATGIGLFDLREQVTLARFAPVRRAVVPWERYAVAQVLPFAALLRGLEVLHAGAVRIDGATVAVTAPSTGGKSTLLAALVQRGGALVADDVLALEVAAGEVIAHPGPGLLSLRDSATEPLGGPAALDALGPLAGTMPGSSWRAVPREAGATPLAALVVLQRSANVRGVDLRVNARPDPRALIGATFNAAWQEPGRMTRMLDVCAAIAAGVPILSLRASLQTAPGRLAGAVAGAVAQLP